ncbi:hypothetical protein [Variovorax sp. GB1P17]|uniref:hypothetical protein n=1 Tax=Variovorax sp. GB1P17 TaxID=3443740 RepID=UPI003F48F99C
MRQTELDRMLAQIWLAEIAAGIIGLLIMLYLLYLVIRWGVRDGMRDAQQGLRSNREPARNKPNISAQLPDMRAD